jgi:hypothetical protein
MRHRCLSFGSFCASRGVFRSAAFAGALVWCGIHLSVHPAAAAVATYNISDVSLDTVPHQVPAINNSGQVSFIGKGAVNVWNGTTISRVAVGAVTGFKANTAINDSGKVAFTNGSGIYLSSVGGSLVTIADRTTLPAQTIFESPSLNNAGTVAFTGGVYGFSTGTIKLYEGSGSGTAAELATLGSYDLGESKPRPAINSSGTIAITGRGIGGAKAGVYLTTGGALTPVATASGSGTNITDFGDASINSSGVLTVSHAPLFGAAQLLTGTGSPLSVYSDSTGPFATFQDETGYSDGNNSINSSGTIAFLAYVKPYNGFASGGIFNGLDLAANKIVRAGDPLDGSTIKELDFGPFGQNDQGQVAFWALLNDGRSGIFMASPLPEPSSLMLVGIGLVTILRRNRR